VATGCSSLFRCDWNKPPRKRCHSYVNGWSKRYSCPLPLKSLEGNKKNNSSYQRIYL